MMRSGSNPSEEQAARWAARLDGGTLSRKEALRLQAWLDANPAHEDLLHELLSLHGQAGNEVREMVAAGALHTRDMVARSVFSKPWLWVSMAAAASLALVLFWPQAAPQEITTVAAQRESVTLEDTTQVDLNARTTLAVTISGKERLVRLVRGEAYFNVAKEKTRPFRIDTPMGSIHVKGTAFNVRTEPSGVMEVTVIEGAVQVVVGADVFSLRPAEQMLIDGSKPQLRVLNEPSRNDAIAWRRGRIVFDQTPLKVALERFARHHDRQIDVDTSVEALRLGGRFKLDDFDGFLRDLEVALPVTVTRSDKGGPILVRRR